MRSIFFIFLGIALTSVLHGQIEPGWISKKSYVEAAERTRADKDYFSSLNFYLEALDFDSTDTNVLYQTAESARLFNSYNLAQQMYARTIELDSTDRYFKASFWLAAMLQRQGKYDEAIDQYTLYISQYDEKDAYLTNRAEKEISSCQWAKIIVRQAAENISIYREGDRINTPDSEFGGVLESDGLTFSALKNYDETARVPLKPYSKVFSITGDQLAVEYGQDFNRKSMHTAHTAYNTTRSRVYYTLCEYKNGNDIRCDIYYRTILGDGTMGNEVKLDSTINLQGYTSTQPNIGFDTKLGKEVFYFVSDRPAPQTQGRSDLNIWYAPIGAGGRLDRPVYLESLNTPEDDITPFFHSNSQVLYFSSEGYTSLGGFDVYRSTKNTSGGWKTPENMGAPVNSSYNDIYYFLEKEGEKGLLSSNRDSSVYVPISLKSTYLVEESESCCYDIYRVTIGDLDIRLVAHTFDARSLDSLAGVTMTIIDAETGAILGTVTNDLSSEHIFQLEKGKSYTVISSKDKYITDTMQMNTNAVYQSGDINKKIYLRRSTLDLQALTFDKISRSPLVGVTVTLEDLTDTTIAPVIITNSGGNDASFEVIPGRKYRLTGHKERYYDDVQEFVANDGDGSGIVVKRLFLDRRDLNIYLPLAVYFDNDLPDKRSLSLNTSKTYTETFDGFVLKKQEFKKNFANGLRGTDRANAEKQVDDFFLNQVNRGFDQLQNFMAAMLEHLQQGKVYDLSIRGYTSPRADSRYNLALGQRRVKAMRNEITSFKNGALIPFMDKGQLKITELSYGENLVPPGVVDSFNDRRNSIYSPQASKERRAEIVEIRTQNSEINN